MTRLQDDISPTFLQDTLLGAVHHTAARGFDLRQRTQRDSLRALLKRERGLWHAARPRDYRFLLRTQCFCPGPRGWLLIEDRQGQRLRAWDARGKAARLSDWDTFGIDALYDNVERWIDHPSLVAIAFDARRHFPSYIRTVAVPGPDAWAIIEVRALRPL